MNIDDALRDLADGESGRLPRSAMQWALANWETAEPRFTALLHRCATGLDRSESTASALFFIVHLCGEQGETRAFASLCRLLMRGEAAEEVLGDAVTENLSRILISTFNGDAELLKAVIEAVEADEFVRAAALEAMAYLARTGAIPEDEMRAYMLHLHAHMRPRGPSYIWTAWAFVAANLGYETWADKVERLIARGVIDPWDMKLDDFTEMAARAAADPDGMAGFEYDKVRPFADAVGSLSRWYGFSERSRIERERASLTANRVVPDDPIRNVLRHVGRNDACPCGSGKKFKKCCLDPVPFEAETIYPLPGLASAR